MVSTALRDVTLDLTAYQYERLLSLAVRRHLSIARLLRDAALEILDRPDAPEGPDGRPTWTGS